MQIMDWGNQKTRVLNCRVAWREKIALFFHSVPIIVLSRAGSLCTVSSWWLLICENDWCNENVKWASKNRVQYVWHSACLDDLYLSLFFFCGKRIIADSLIAHSKQINREVIDIVNALADLLLKQAQKAVISVQPCYFQILEEALFDMKIYDCHYHLLPPSD